MILEVSNAAYVYFLITFVPTKIKQKNNNEDSQAQKVSRTAFFKRPENRTGHRRYGGCLPRNPGARSGAGHGCHDPVPRAQRPPPQVVEIDFESVAYLRTHYPQLEENIIEDDFLKMHLERTFGGQPFVLTGNYPYNISSQIFFKMLDYKDLIPCCTGMIQKEVAERIAAGPGSKTYGILSVLLQAWYSVEYLFTVHEHVFNPPPKVKSAVIRMTRNATTDLGCDERLFKQVVKTTFNQRRKVLRNSIRPVLADADHKAQQEGRQPKDHTEFLSAEIFGRRPEQLSVAEFVNLTNAVARETSETA